MADRICWVYDQMGSGISSAYNRVKSKYNRSAATKAARTKARYSSSHTKSLRSQNGKQEATSKTDELDWITSVTKQCKFGLEKCNCCEEFKSEAIWSPIIIDTGSVITRAGFASDDQPRCAFPTMVSYQHEDKASSSILEETGDCGMMRVGRAMALKADDSGTTSPSQPSILISVIICPVVKGVVEDWDYMEKIWHHAFYNELNISPIDKTVILTEGILSPKRCRERTAFVMFSQFKVSCLVIRDSCVLSLYQSQSSGETGCVLSSGFSMTYAVPVCNYFSVPHAVKSSSFAGMQLTTYLRKLLEKENRHKCDLTPQQLDYIKEKHCFVADDCELALSEANMRAEPIIFNNTIITKARFLCPEAMFRTSPAMPSAGAPRLLYNSIADCNADLHKEMWGNIVCTGGNTLLKGFTKRLQAELMSLVRSDMRVVVVGCAHAHTSWQGARVLSSLPCFEGE